MRKANAIVVDLGARLVRREGIEVHLAPKAFELLLILVRNQPNAVPHEQLHAALWPGVHVSETSLAALVTQLRKALGDSSGDGRVIRTLHRVGYAFIGEAVVAGQTPIIGAPVCRLIWRGESIEVHAGESVIGRDRGCEVQIDADSVSRRHAQLNVIGREVSIDDLGSKNGTFRGQERVTESVTLADGDLVRIGSIALKFHMRQSVVTTDTSL